nr:phospholipase-like protein [Tanacetum cinerariifolium]
AFDPNKDPRERSFDDYKWVFDLEVEQLADEYELRIGKKGHMLEMIWENCKNIQDHGFVGYPFDYRVTLGFGSIAGGLDLVSPVIRLPIKRGINSSTREVRCTWSKYIVLSGNAGKPLHKKDYTAHFMNKNEFLGQFARKLYIDFDNFALSKLPVWNGMVVSKGYPLSEDQRPQLHTTPLLAVGEPIPEKRTISITLLHHAAPKLVDEPVTSAPKNIAGDATTRVWTTNVEKEVVVLSEYTNVPTPLVTVAQPSLCAEDADSQEHLTPFTPPMIKVMMRARRSISLCQSEDSMMIFTTVMSEPVEKIKQLEKVIGPKSRQLADAEEKIRVLEEEKNLWLGGLSLGKKEDEIAKKVANSYLLSLDELMKVSPDVHANDDAGLAKQASPKVHTAGIAIGTSPRTTT